VKIGRASPENDEGRRGTWPRRPSAVQVLE
jgi:hypothetical protein